MKMKTKGERRKIDTTVIKTEINIFMKMLNWIRLLLNEQRVNVSLGSAGQLFLAFRYILAEYNFTRFEVSSRDMKEVQSMP